MAWFERTRRQTGTALALVLLVSLLVGGTAVAAGRAFTHAGQLTASAGADGLVAAVVEPTSAHQIVRQAYDLLLDNFVTPPPPSDLLAQAAGAVIRRVSDDVPGEWAAPTFSSDAGREAAW